MSAVHCFDYTAAAELFPTPDRSHRFRAARSFDTTYGKCAPGRQKLICRSANPRFGASRRSLVARRDVRYHNVCSRSSGWLIGAGLCPVIRCRLRCLTTPAEMGPAVIPAPSGGGTIVLTTTDDGPGTRAGSIRGGRRTGESRLPSVGRRCGGLAAVEQGIRPAGSDPGEAVAGVGPSGSDPER